jgi:hypothetical protein
MSDEDVSALPEIDEPLWATRSWLHAETLESLAEVNEQCLELLCDQAAVTRTGPAMLAELRPLWRELDVSARRRVARCPCLLLDAGFAAASRWAAVHDRRVHDRERPPAGVAFFTVPCTVSVMRLVLTYAWFLARTQSVAARLLLGMSGQCARLIGACTLREVTLLAESQPQWLKPRWSERPSVWRELLTTASSGEPQALERLRMRGMQLLAGEVRSVRDAD